MKKIHEKTYSVTNVVEEFNRTLQTYLEAQYHIWDESLIRERKAFLERNGTISQTPLLEATPHYAYGKSFNDLTIPPIAKHLLNEIAELNIGLFKLPYQHQSEALERFLVDDKNIIIATGTGSGKTESFLMPLISSLAIEAHDKQETSCIHGMRSLILYPMNALVNDQMSRLRRILGDTRVADLLKKNRGRNITFGMYTGRTEYPGARSSDKDLKLKKKINKLSGGNSVNYKHTLEKEGKWPAKDMEEFIRSGFKTNANDRELFTRHEMQEKCPDVLVTNYSMLEYMLIRPIESSIFNQTIEWLNSDPTNQFTIVIDEAHMYRGAAGAEVGLLLRRLQSRLGIGRDRIKYILTSASLGNTPKAHLKVKEFAADLTGLVDKNQAFELILGKVENHKNSSPASNKDTIALENFPYSILHKDTIQLQEAISALEKLVTIVSKYKLPKISSQEELRLAVNDFLEQYPPACELSNYITSNPRSLIDIQNHVFPNSDSDIALESLMALCTYGMKNDGRVYLPIRLHTFFRGISGIYACINPECSYKNDKKSDSGLLGKFFDFPRRNCECGCRVYELLTHRDCGAAFIKVFLKKRDADFAWHQNSSLSTGGNSLLEAHCLIEVDRNRSIDGAKIWLHKKTGKILRKLANNNPKDYLPLIISDKSSQEYIPRNTFIKACPVCMHKWFDNNIKIMDLATKGEAPFAHLVTTQLKTQPPRIGNNYSNQGRKNLLFSDGRQKAARLARDIPREIQQDVFRQVLLYAADSFKNHDMEANVAVLYPAFLWSLREFNLNLFDGADNRQIIDDIRSINREEYNFPETIHEFRDPPPEGFNQELLRQLGSSFYSLQALTLAYVIPTNKTLAQLQKKIPFLDIDSIKSLAVVWIQSFLNHMALDKKISNGARTMARGGFPNKKWGRSNGFSERKKKFITPIYENIEQIESAFIEFLTEGESGAYFISSNKIAIKIAINDNWHQCQKCAYISPVTFKNHCVACGAQGVIELNPETSDYLRARKTFWRDPVVSILQHHSKPTSLNVCEHTAQLSHRDQEQVSSTTEEFERLFKDIILDAKTEQPIDILSCTTTMEVGIDIGALIAVGLRNIPPERQNYQQRVGRAGRRGAAISTIVTYAQNSPHDHYYFKNIKKIISGEPPTPIIDISNPRLIKRHIHSAVMQYFFHNEILPLTNNSGVFDAMGKTWDFYNKTDDFTFQEFKKWISSDVDAKKLITLIQTWVPSKANVNVLDVIEKLIISLDNIRPESEKEISEENKDIISFLFNSDLLPSYAFPKDLCSIQIEKLRKDNNYDRVEVIERAQQGLNVALSEYAPGKLIVLNKLTYRIACVAANKPHTEQDRAKKLFTQAKTYNHCHECFYTLPTKELNEDIQRNCPICDSNKYEAITVIQPEMVFPENSKPIDERDDEQIFTSATNAQLPVAKDEKYEWEILNDVLKYSHATSQNLIMLNKGESKSDEFVGFEVCTLCGDTLPGGSETGKPHKRHYLIEGPRHIKDCEGIYKNVNLGYSFSSDVFLMRISLEKPLDINLKNNVSKKALEDGLLSLCESISMASCHVLDIDPRELKSGYRLINIKDKLYADIFIYDSIAGGAGYSSMAGQKIEEILDDSQEVLNTCDCLSSCQKCLRHYGNKHYHTSLDRKLALILLNYARYETLPEIKSISEQQQELSILKEILELEGWDVIENELIPLCMRRNNKIIKFSSSPSLFDPQELNHPLKDECSIVSSYRLDNDITGVFSEVG